MTYLFTSEEQPAGADKLVPNFDTIDILNKFRWTISPAGAIEDVPFALFEEQELDLSSLITGVVYKIRGGIDNLANWGLEAERIVGLASQEKLAKAQKEKEKSSSFIRTYMAGSNDPYKGLYVASKTGWNYVFPYLETQFHNISNSWGDEAPKSGSILKGLIGKGIVGAVEGAIATTGIANVAAPGSHAEKSKFYNPSGGGDTYTISFPLLNTFDAEDVQKNWELCYVLTYQNLPNRRTINLLDPPALYTVTIPGIRYTPLGYISKLDISHVGNIRYLEIPGVGRKPIPEAYKITITITELITHSRNMMQYALKGSDKVSAIISSDDRPSATVSREEIQDTVEWARNNIPGAGLLYK